MKKIFLLFENFCDTKKKVTKKNLMIYCTIDYTEILNIISIPKNSIWLSYLWEAGTAYPSQAHGFTPSLFGGVKNAHLFSFLFSLSLFWILMPMLPISGLSILDCPFPQFSLMFISCNDINHLYLIDIITFDEHYISKKAYSFPAISNTKLC